MVIVEGTIKGKAIKGYEERYRVFEDGRIVSIAKSPKNKNRNKDLKHWIDKDGYHTVSLFKNGKSKQFRVHRLVAEAFIENFNNLPQVNHIDGNKDNNSVENLEWISLQDNIRHAYKIGIYKKGEDRKNSKFTNEQVKWIRKNYIKGDKEFGSRPIARKFGVTKTCIYLLVNYKTYKEVE